MNLRKIKAFNTAFFLGLSFISLGLGNIATAAQVESSAPKKIVSEKLNLNFDFQPGVEVANRATYSGQASWYGPGFHGRRTANGEVFNSNALTAAHRSLPFGTKVRVTNVNNGRSVVVRINDRGPFSGGRIIDLSAGAARSINMINSGVAPVRVEVLGI
ncbi:rare lipoprotein A [Xenococcus sp. PCC 7305]|nr:septal ring lytic transglycosylase RlpA family protein [Xenococcus sp. PCC 7305]ELS05359.1 rare lipoprotein A [Xenococcus sp. PCC 7305]